MCLCNSEVFRNDLPTWMVMMMSLGTPLVLSWPTQGFEEVALELPEDPLLLWWASPGCFLLQPPGHPLLLLGTPPRYFLVCLRLWVFTQSISSIGSTSGAMPGNPMLTEFMSSICSTSSSWTATSDSISSASVFSSTSGSFNRDCAFSSMIQSMNWLNSGSSWTPC